MASRSTLVSVLILALAACSEIGSSGGSIAGNGGADAAPDTEPGDRPDEGTPDGDPATPDAAPVGETTSYTCTEVIGFSQTIGWYTGSDFETLVDDARWQLRGNGGASIDKWSDPNYAGWNVNIRSGCTAGGDAPDRVVLTISGGAGDDVAQWAAWITETVGYIQDTRYPNVNTIVLQPVVGGPQEHLGEPCVNGGQRVRASYQHPYIMEAVEEVALAQTNEGRDVRVGADPHVTSCADYSDGTGHLTNNGYNAAGNAIGAAYAATE